MFALPVALFAGLIIFFGYGLTQDPSHIPSILIDKPLPKFDLPGLDANSPGFGSAAFGSATARGEPKLLNVFGSWCPSCPQEHPMLTQIASEGVPVYGLDWKDTPEKAQEWLARFGNPYHRIASDPTARAGINLGVTGTPETFVVDGHGRVRYKQIGPITADDWEKTLKPMLARLRNEA
ncbi:MAG: DsbE family thiol:disulfide interchange protein [Janthinobacterium lividum]